MKVNLTPSGRHKQKILIIDNKRVYIDVDLVEVIQVLLINKIKTNNSCQNSCCGWCNKVHKKVKRCKNYVFISFDSVEDKRKFLRLIIRNDSFKRLMYGDDEHKDSWIWNSYDDEKRSFISCVFPRKHLKIVIERLIAGLV